MESLKGKVTLITGAGSGFGKATSLYFAKYNAKLVLADINFQSVEEVERECQESGLPLSDVIAVKSNITKEDERRMLIKRCIDHFGRLDVLVNNAGIGRFYKLEETTEDVFDELINLNVKAHLFLTKLAVPYLKQTKGCIVNISSIAAVEPQQIAVAYSMTKAAIDIFTKAVAVALAPSGVRVNAVRPGVVLTNIFNKQFGENTSVLVNSMTHFHPLGRLGTVEDIAKCIAFLSCDLSSFTTGHCLDVEGGRLNSFIGNQTISIAQAKL